MTSSQDKYHTLPKASTEAYVAAAAQQRRRLQDHCSCNKLRDSSEEWKSHYDTCQKKWGAIASGQAPTPWDEIHEQKEKGEYPWTHLSHDQDAEVWIDPTALPQDLSRVTIRGKDQSIPREWFHLPKGAEAPTVEELLRDSSPEESANSLNQVKHPPICGRSRSKSRERRPNKRFVDDGGYEPVGGGVIKPLNQIMLPVPVNKYGKSTNGHGIDKVGDHKTHGIPPRKALTALPTPPSVDRTTKPPISPTKENVDDQAAAAGGYEPIGKPLQPKKKDYEDVVFKQIKSPTPTIPLPIPKDVYAKVDLDSKAKEKEAKALKEQEEKHKKQREKEEQEQKEHDEKERRQKEKLQKQTEEKKRKEHEKAEKEEKKLKEKQEKERKEKEEKERKQREKESKDRDKREKSEKAENEKKDKEKKQQEKNEMEAKKLKDKQDKEQKEKEDMERKVHEKEEKEKAKAELAKQEKDRKQHEKTDMEGKKLKEKQEKEEKDKAEKLRKQHEEEETERQKQRMAQLAKEEEDRKATELKEREKVDGKAIDLGKDEEEEKTLQAEREWQEHLQMEEQLKQQWEMEQEQERERQEIRLMMSDNAEGDQFNDYFGNEHTTWVSTDDDQINNVHMTTMPIETKIAPAEVPMSKKEKKELEKALKKQKEKEEKERKIQEKELKKQEKEMKKKEEQERKLQSKKEKEEEKQRKKEEKLAKETEKKGKAEMEKQKIDKKPIEKEVDKINESTHKTEIHLETVPNIENGFLEKAAEEVEDIPDSGVNPHENYINEEIGITGEQQVMEDGEEPAEDQFQSFFHQQPLDESPTDEQEFADEVMWQPAAEDNVYKVSTQEDPDPVSKKDKGKKKKVNQEPNFQLPKVELPKVEMPKMPEMPKVDVKAKLTSLNESIRTTHIPSPQELKEGYMNSNFQKSFTQQLTVRTRTEDADVQKAREFMIQRKTPAELSQMNHPLDIPLPKFKLPSLRNVSFPEDDKKGLEKDHQAEDNKINQFSGTFPRSGWGGQQNIVTSNRVIADEDEVNRRKELVKTKTPAQLAEFHSIGDFPIPSKVKSFLSPSERKIMSQKQRKMSMASAKSDKTSDVPWRLKLGNIFKGNTVMGDGSTAKIQRSKSETALENNTLMRSGPKLITNVKVEAETDELNCRRALAASKSPAELAQMNSLGDVPIPGTLRRMVSTTKRVKISAPALPHSKSLTDLPNISSSIGLEGSGFLKKSLNAQCLVRSRMEDPHVQAARAEMVKNRTVAQLSQVTSLSDIPIPTSLLAIVEKRDKSKERPIGDEKKQQQPAKTMQDYIPDGLKSQLRVGTKSNQDQDVVRERQQLVRSKSPAQLSELHHVGDLPIPSMLHRSRLTSPFPTDTAKDFSLAENSEGTGFYHTLPRSLKSELRVRSKIEDPETQQLRAEAVNSKSVHELSEIKSFEDIPLPSTLQNLVGRATGGTLRPVERRKKFRDKQKSLSSSTKSLQDRLQDPKQFLPDSLTSQQILVVSKFQDPSVLNERRAMVQSKSVSELSQIPSVFDLPVPTQVEKFLTATRTSRKRKPKSEMENQTANADYSQFSPMAIHDNIYSTLPRSMKIEVLVTSKVQLPTDLTQARKDLVSSKSVGELSQVNTLADLPIPTPIQNMWEAAGKRRRGEHLRSNDDDIDGESISTALTGRSSRLADIRNYDIYSTLPKSLKKEVLVRSKIEGDYETLMKRQALVNTKTPAELSQIATLAEIPIPRKIEDWLQHSNRPSSASRTLRDISPMKVLPEAMTKQCLVRCKNENPSVLHERQHIISTNTPHELSKIRNLKEVPMPIKRLQLPDIPLPSAKYMFKSPHRKVGHTIACQTEESSFEGFTPASTPLPMSEHSEALRFEMSSPESALLPRDTDFGYEVIDKPDQGQEGDNEDASSVSVADHYRGTPPLKGKKKKHPGGGGSGGSQNTKHSKDDSSVGETPPPLPPKKRDSQREREASVESATSYASYQSRPLPTPPTPRNKRDAPQPPAAVEVEEDNDEFHSLISNTLPTPPTPRVKRDAPQPPAAAEVDEDNDEFHSLISNATGNVAVEEPTSEKYHSLVESKSLTLLVDQPEEHVDETLAESIIDSMHTCVDTITLEDDALPVDNNSHENTLNVPGMDSDEENDEYMAEMLPHDNVKERESTPTV